MLTPEKIKLLQTLLRGLPDPVSLRLARAVELDRSAGGTVLPHALILEALRPNLRKARGQARASTPLRLFCMPFEDLLSDLPRKEKRKAGIARSTIIPLWIWVSQTLLPVEARSYAERVSAAGKASVPAAAFWPRAGEAIAAALATDPKEARRALGGDLAVADAREIALLLAAGKDIAALQEILPHGTSTLSDPLMRALREIYHRIAEAVPDAAPYVAVIAMARLERPWEALKLPLQVTRQSSDTLISSTDIGLAGEVLLADLDRHVAAVRAARHPDFDADDLCAHVGAFTRLSNGLAQEVELRRDGVWHQRLMNDRKAVGDAMEALMERVPREIIAATPVHRTGSYGGGPKAPDISKPLDGEKVDRALRYARLVVASRNFAAAASFGATQRMAYDEVVKHLKSYSEDIVREVRAVDGARRAIAEKYAGVAADLMAILFSEEEAEFLRRRTRAATAAAA